MKVSKSIIKIICIASITLLASSLFTGCDKKDSKKTALAKISLEKKSDKKNEISSNKLTIGFSIDTLAIERWQRDLDVFMNKAKELGANVIVQNAGNSTEEQNRQLMYLADRNVDVIVVLPKQADAITDSITKIKAKGIPVISYDRLTLNAPVDMYITINSERVGELMASKMLQLSRGTNWYCILGPEEDFNMTFIQRGINKVIWGSPYHISYTFHTEGWNYDLAYQQMVRLLNTNQIPDAIICGNDALAESVIQAITLYYNDKHIPICGQDADIAACQNIVQNKQDFTIYKPIAQLAETCAEYAYRLASGEKLEIITENMPTIDNNYDNIPVLWLDPTLVSNENLDKVIIESGFHTHGEVYRN